jgi:hypothetical protein
MLRSQKPKKSAKPKRTKIEAPKMDGLGASFEEVMKALVTPKEAK